MLGHDPADRGGPPKQVALHADVGLVLGGDGGRSWRPRHEPIALGGRGVHDDHGASRVVRHAVRHVPQEELLAAAHAEVAHHQHVDPLLLGGLDDGPRGIGVDHHAGLAPWAGDLLGQLAEFGRGERCPGRLGRARFGARPLLGDQDLQEVQLRPEPPGHVGRPIDRPRGALRAIGGDHDLLHRKASMRARTGSLVHHPARAPASCGMGNRPVKVVPSAGAERTSIAPPSADNRSAMPCRPVP